MNRNERGAILICKRALENRAVQEITADAMKEKVRQNTDNLITGLASFRALESARASAKIALYQVASKPNPDGSPNLQLVEYARRAIAAWERVERRVIEVIGALERLECIETKSWLGT
jgi:hypothetical protein